MPQSLPFICPACNEGMHVSELTCPHCLTKIQGDFISTGIQRLKRDQLEFIEVFVRCRGNIKEVEKDLKISYPTVRARLDQIIRDMGYTPEATTPTPDEAAIDIINAIENGLLTVEEAVAKLKGGKMNE